MLLEEIRVHCDACGEEYCYKPKEVLRAEIPVRDNFGRRLLEWLRRIETEPLPQRVITVANQ
jgi:hypothetical protein